MGRPSGEVYGKATLSETKNIKAKATVDTDSLSSQKKESEVPSWAPSNQEPAQDPVHAQPQPQFSENHSEPQVNVQEPLILDEPMIDHPVGAGEDPKAGPSCSGCGTRSAKPVAQPYGKAAALSAKANRKTA